MFNIKKNHISSLMSNTNLVYEKKKYIKISFMQLFKIH